MKKKFLIGAIGLASVFVLTSAGTRDDNSSDTDKRPMFGTSAGWYTDCSPNPGGDALGNTYCTCTYHWNSYFFWIEFEHSEVHNAVPC